MGLSITRKAECVSEENTVSLNLEEQEVIASQLAEEEKSSKQISTKKMELAVDCVSEEFCLSEGGYVMTAFSDKGNKSQVSLSNADFDIVVTIKDNEKFGIQ